jgi:hypothetical protein
MDDEEENALVVLDANPDDTSNLSNVEDKTYNGESLDNENVPFAQTPAIAIQGIINYQMTSGRKMYMGAIAKFLDEELYDCKPEGLYQFLQQSLSN